MFATPLIWLICCGWAGCPRRGSRTPGTRELRELVRHRAKLVGLRSHCKAEVHAVLAKCGTQVLMTDLFGVPGNDLLDRVALPGPYAARVQSLLRLIEDLEVEIDLFSG